MTALDWSLVILLNGGIVLYALVGARRSDTSREWFLGGRSLPWWIVGVSAFATAIDSSDLVADSGGVYTLGVSYFVTNWVGTVVGWVLLAHFVAVPMYRRGMITNSEYLEARFGPTARVLSSLVQVQYRTMVLANISTTLFLTFSIVGGLGGAAWWGVALVLLMAVSYTILGGSRSVAITDVVQSVVMVGASLILFTMVWNAVGGWQGLESKLAAHDVALPEQLLHVGGDHVEVTSTAGLTDEQRIRQLLLGGDYNEETETITHRSSAWLVCLSFFLVGMAYSIVNHEQSMRMFAARSLWDMKMSVAVASFLLIAITFFNLMMGIMGRALYPSRELLPVAESLRGTADAIYPVLVREFTGIGFQGLVIAGLLAAAISTYAGIGTAMATLLTRDIYARHLVRDREDAHYVMVGRCLTPVVVFGSLLYVPFLLRDGMMSFYLDLVATFVIPMLTVFLMGTFTRVHRSSGTVGILAGVLYGIIRLVAGGVAETWGVAVLPSTMADRFAAYPISMLVTAGVMVLVSLLLGWETRDSLSQLSADVRVADIPEAVEENRSNVLPNLLGGAAIILGVVLSFVVFW